MEVAAREHARGAAPGVEDGVVDLHRGEPGDRVPVEGGAAAAEHRGAGDADGGVVRPGRAHRSALAPAVGDRVVDLDGGDAAPVGGAPGDEHPTAVEQGGGVAGATAGEPGRR